MRDEGKRPSGGVPETVDRQAHFNRVGSGARVAEWKKSVLFCSVLTFGRIPESEFLRLFSRPLLLVAACICVF